MHCFGFVPWYHVNCNKLEQRSILYEVLFQFFWKRDAMSAWCLCFCINISFSPAFIFPVFRLQFGVWIFSAFTCSLLYFCPSFMCIFYSCRVQKEFIVIWMMKTGICLSVRQDSTLMVDALVGHSFQLKSLVFMQASFKYSCLLMHYLR